MEHLINIIIVFVIIASILKRIREVGETRGTLAKPQQPGQRPTVTPVPGPVPPLTQQPIPVDQMPPPQPVTEAPSVSEMMEQEIETVYHEPEIPALRPVYDTAFSEEAWEQAQRDIEERIRESQESYRRVRKQSAPVMSAERPVQKPARVRGLRFTGDAVVNGIIMSEILGSPKSLRQENW